MKIASIMDIFCSDLCSDEDDDSDADSDEADVDMDTDENKHPDDEYNFDNYDNEGEAFSIPHKLMAIQMANNCLHGLFFFCYDFHRSLR